ncbi:MAG: glycerol-3-phosphate acyltransferase, partial [Vulcanimicrobiaceae bacterium]
MKEAGAIIFAFFLGSLPFGMLVARVFFKTDIRAQGSGNIGAANAARTLGKGAGALVLAL